MDVITFLVNLLTNSGLSILLHGVISLPDATSYDKNSKPPCELGNFCVLTTVESMSKLPPTEPYGTILAVIGFICPIISLEY